jgi:anti-sigma factor RsiW
MNPCESFRIDFDAFRDRVLGRDRASEVREHLQTCHSCRTEIHSADAIEQALQENATSWTASPDLWLRILNSTNSLKRGTGQIPGRWLSPQLWVAALALVLIVGVVGFNFSQLHRQTPVDSVVSALVNEFHTFVISRRGLDYVNTQPHEIKEWFDDKVDFRVPLPVRADDIQLAGGRLCNMLDQRVASYMYQSDGDWVSLYIMKPVNNRAGETPGQEIMVKGYGYIDWQKSGLHYSLIGDITVDRLRQIAIEINTSRG